MFEIQQIIAWLYIYKYLVIFPLIILEGPITSVICGFLSSVNILNIFIVYPVLVVADLVGDLLYYSLGRWGGSRFVRKYIKLFRLSEKTMTRIENHFDKHTKKTIIIGKISHAFGAPILIAAGIVKVRLYEIFWSNIVVTIPKYLVLLIVGYYFGVILINNAEYFSIILLSLGILIILVVLLYNRIKRKLAKIIEA
jgi:membrane protein DedA with SNARE-associated domain